MTFATGGFHGLSYDTRPTFGGALDETPKYLRITGTTLNLSKPPFQSAELRSDRQIVATTHGNKVVQGDINIELSYGTFDEILEGALFGTWTANVLESGVTEKFFDFERIFADVGQYAVASNCMVNTFNLTVNTEGIVGGSFGVIGKDMVFSTTRTLVDGVGGMPTATNTLNPFNSFKGTLTEGGAPIAVVTSIELSVDNGLEAAYVVGSQVTPRIVAGRSNVSGTMTCFFENTTLLNKFINETESSLEFVLEDTDTGATHGNRYTFTLPRIKYNGGDLPVNNEGPIVLSMPFQALYHSGTGTNLYITRTVKD